MNPTRPRPLLRPARRLLGPFLFSVVAVPLAFPLAFRIARSPVLLLELAIYAAILTALLAAPIIREPLLALATWRRWLLAWLMGLAVFAQLMDLPQFTYPLVNWSMYSQVQPENTFIRYDAIRESGQEQELPFERLTPSRSPRAVMAAVNELAQGTKPDDRLSLERALIGLANVDNRRRPEDRIREIRVSHCGVAMQGPDAGGTRCSPLHTVEVP